MIQILRKFTALVTTVVLMAALVVPAMAVEEIYIDNGAYTPDALKAISEIQKKSLSSGVVSMELGESHCAVLFADGTVMAFQCDGWFGGGFDYKECNTAKWSGIREIACRSECTFGLKKDGSIVWAGKPELCGFDSGDDIPDDGWKKISRGKNYTDIACDAYMPLFALTSKGTVDIAFDPGNSFAAVKDLNNIIDIMVVSRDGIRCFAALASDGTVSVISEYSPEMKRYLCMGAEKICVRDGSLCVVMRNGKVQPIGYRFPEDNNAEEAIRALQQEGAVSACWAPDDVSGSNISGAQLARMQKGSIYLVASDYSGSRKIKEINDWEKLRDACEISLKLPASGDNEVVYSMQCLRIILGVLENGVLCAEYYMQ